MQKPYDIRYNDKVTTITLEEVGVCPLCHFATSPHYDGGYLIPPKDNSRDPRAYAYLILYCSNCHEQYIACYRYNSCEHDLIYTFPSRPNPVIFDDFILQISPRFSIIYNQAKQAEETALNELAGIGYRKALEFLVKDYLIEVQNEDRPTIEAMQLGQCISKIDDDKILTLSKSAAWIGNDETHYIRKHLNHNVEHLKLFILAKQ